MTKKLLFLLLLACVSVAVAKEDMYAAKRAIREGNYAEAYCLLKPMAKAGDSEAQYQIGWMYHNGYGLAVDDLQAAFWWEKSARKEMPDALMALVLLYREGGIGVEQDLHKAADYLLRAAQLGDEEARLLLSYFLDNPDWALKREVDKVVNANPEALGPAMYVLADKTNLRTAANTSSSVIETTGQGEKLILLARRKEWAHVVFLRKKVLAWVHIDLIGTSPVVTR